MFSRNFALPWILVEVLRVFGGGAVPALQYIDILSKYPAARLCWQMHDAYKHIKDFPSTAPESGTMERGTKQFCERVINTIEVDDTI